MARRFRAILITAVIVLAGASLAASFIGGGLRFTDGFRVIKPIDKAAFAQIKRGVSPRQFGQRILAALSEGDQDTAAAYAQLAERADVRLEADVRRSLQRADAARETFIENRSSDLFVTGSAVSAATLSGAIVADMTARGHRRDIAAERAKLLRGEPSNRFLLGLSVIGALAVEADAAAWRPEARVGVSVLKVASATGELTGEFAQLMARLLSRTIDFPALERSFAPDAGAVIELDPTEDYVRNMASSELLELAAGLGRLADLAGPGEAVKLIGEVRETADLQGLIEMAEVFGSETQAVVELSGKSSLSEFDRTMSVGWFLGENLVLLVFWALLLGAAILLPERLWNRGGGRA